MIVPYGQHPHPGAPGTWQREVYWALFRAQFSDRYNVRRGVPLPYSYQGMRVLRADPRHPYGRSTGKNAFLTHIPVGIAIAWRRGRVVGHMVQWRCGARTVYFRLMDEPESPFCPVCLMNRERP
jgi:hypothetical protein